MPSLDLIPKLTIVKLPSARGQAVRDTAYSHRSVLLHIDRDQRFIGGMLGYDLNALSVAVTWIRD